MIDTHIAVALAHCFFNVPLAIWILEGFMSAIPREMDDSARLDGYSTFRFFCRILLPQIAPGIAVTAFFCFMFSWIETLLANALTVVEAKPINGLAVLFSGTDRLHAESLHGDADHMKIKTIMAGGLALCLLLQPAGAGQLEDGYAAFAREDYANALKLLTPLADQGNVGAQTQLGMMYEHALGVPQDYAVALKLFRLSSEQGYFAAQYNLSAMYSKGTGVKQDHAEAAKWLKLAAEQGFGQHSLFSDGCIVLAKSCRLIMCRLTCGTAWPLPTERLMTFCIMLQSMSAENSPRRK